MLPLRGGYEPILPAYAWITQSVKSQHASAFRLGFLKIRLFA